VPRANGDRRRDCDSSHRWLARSGSGEDRRRDEAGLRFPRPARRSFFGAELAAIFQIAAGALRHPAPRARNLAFALHGPIHPLRGDRSRRYWREAPLLGLAGESEIVVTRRGVAAEAVEYDLNIASDALRDGGSPRAWANS
jgi:hypothetical protein